MELKFAPAAAEFLTSLPPPIKHDVRAALRKLVEDPRHPDLDVKLLRKEGPYRFFRARVRDYRVIYSPVGDDTFVWRIQHRSEGYDWFERLDPTDGS